MLLIGPAPYARRINIERPFAALKAAIKVEKVLDKKEVEVNFRFAIFVVDIYMHFLFFLFNQAYVFCFVLFCFDLF